MGGGFRPPLHEDNPATPQTESPRYTGLPWTAIVLTIALLLALVAQCRGQDFGAQLQLEDKYSEHTLIQIACECAEMPPDEAEVSWTVDPPLTPEQIRARRLSVVLTAAPGKYKIRCVIKHSETLSVLMPAVKDEKNAFELPPGSESWFTVVPRTWSRNDTQSGEFEIIASDTPRPEPDEPVEPEPETKVDRVTYVYEKDDNAIPGNVAFALFKLNNQGILASEFERNTVDGTGQVPDQYRIALAAANEYGLPCLVVQAGAKVVRVVGNPTTEAQVMEAIKQ